MKKLLVGLIFIFCSMQLWADSGEPVNSIVAIVNDDVITQAQYNAELKKAEQHAAELPASQRPTPAMFQQMVIQQMINRNLQMQIAKRNNIKISNAEVQDAVKRIAKENKISLKALYAKVAKTGFSPAQFRHEIQNEMLLQTIQHGAVSNRVNISPQEVDDYLHIMQKSKSSSAQYELLDLLIPLPDEPTSTQVDAVAKVADKIDQALKSGTPLKVIFKQYQSGPYAIRENNLGWKKIAELPLPFVNTVEGLSKGQVSSPIKAPNGFHILKLLNVKNAAELSGNSKKQREEVEQMIFQRKYQEALMNWIAQLRSQSYVKINLPGVPAEPQ